MTAKQNLIVVAVTVVVVVVVIVVVVVVVVVAAATGRYQQTYWQNDKYVLSNIRQTVTDCGANRL